MSRSRKGSDAWVQEEVSKWKANFNSMKKRSLQISEISGNKIVSILIKLSGGTEFYIKEKISEGNTEKYADNLGGEIKLNFICVLLYLPKFQ